MKQASFKLMLCHGLAPSTETTRYRNSLLAVLAQMIYLIKQSN